jgi:hypothetical protein
VKVIALKYEIVLSVLKGLLSIIVPFKLLIAYPNYPEDPDMNGFSTLFTINVGHISDNVNDVLK